MSSGPNPICSIRSRTSEVAAACAVDALYGAGVPAAGAVAAGGVRVGGRESWSVSLMGCLLTGTGVAQLAALTVIGSPPRIRNDSIGSGTARCPGTVRRSRSRVISAVTKTASIMPRLLPTQNRGPAPKGM